MFEMTNFNFNIMLTRSNANIIANKSKFVFTYRNDIFTFTEVSIKNWFHL